MKRDKITVDRVYFTHATDEVVIVLEGTRWIGLVVFIAICLGAAALGAIATTPEIGGWPSRVMCALYRSSDFELQAQ